MNQQEMCRVFKLIGESYYRCEADLLSSLLSEECVLKSEIKKKTIRGKQSILDYYHTLFSASQKEEYAYRMLVTRKKQNGYPKGTMGLVIHKKGEKYPSILLLLKFNQEDKIQSILLDEPSLYLYKLYPIQWGEGIPNYSKNDILRDEEIFEFCFQDMFDLWNSSNFKVVMMHNERNAPHHFIVQKKNEKWVILLKASAGIEGNERWPSIPDEEVKHLSDYARKVKGIPYVAVLNMHSKDEERKKALLTLVGDNYAIEAYPLARVEWVDGSVRYYLFE